jgi:putative transposase
MARLARIVVPGVPHHVAARGTRREPIFFEDGDQDIYIDILAEQMRKTRVEVWGYCLMPNHVHLIACPETADGRWETPISSPVWSGSSDARSPAGPQTPGRR